MLLFLALLMTGYALNGLVFGVLPFFVLNGFAELEGLTGLFASLGCIALALGWGSHLVQRHWSTASRSHCESVRSACYYTWGIAWLLALAFLLLPTPSAIPRRLGIAPTSDWLLAPLPWVWRSFAHLAADRISNALFVTALFALALQLLSAKLRWSRIAVFLMGVALAAASGGVIGIAVFRYASARRLSPALASPDQAEEFALDPGAHNAATFCWWWAGLCGLLFAAVFLAGALVNDRRLIVDYQRRMDAN